MVCCAVLEVVDFGSWVRCAVVGHDGNGGFALSLQVMVVMVGFLWVFSLLLLLVVTVLVDFFCFFLGWLVIVMVVVVAGGVGLF